MSSEKQSPRRPYRRPCSVRIRIWAWPRGCPTSTSAARRTLARTTPSPRNPGPPSWRRCRCSSTAPASSGLPTRRRLDARSRFRTTVPGSRRRGRWSARGEISRRRREILSPDFPNLADTTNPKKTWKKMALRQSAESQSAKRQTALNTEA